VLRRRLAYALQAKVHGDLPAEAQRRLKRVLEAMEVSSGSHLRNAMIGLLA
jgi:hypothetical protein